MIIAPDDHHNQHVVGQSGLGHAPARQRMFGGDSELPQLGVDLLPQVGERGQATLLFGQGQLEHNGQRGDERALKQDREEHDAQH